MGKTTLFSRHTPGGVYSIYDEAQTTGNIFWVDSGSSTGGDTAGHGSNPDAPFLTLDFAIGQCTANNGDRIYLMPGHAETVVAAAGIVFDVAGVTCIGIGSGADRPTITVGTAATADIDISAASVTIKNVKFVNALDGLDAPIDIDGADCKLIDIEWNDPNDTECDKVITAAATADRLRIHRFFYNSSDNITGGDQCEICIDLAGTNDAYITNSRFIGLASTAMVNFSTANISTIVKNCVFYNASASLSKNVVDTATGSTWAAIGCFDVGSGGDFSGGSGNAVAGDDLSAISDALFGSTGIASFPAAAAPANNISIAEVLRDIWDVLRNGTGGSEPGTNKSVIDLLNEQTPRIVTKSTGDLTAFGTSKNLFTVTGDVLVRIGASVDVAVTSTSGTTTLEVGVAGNTACLCVQDAVDNTAFAIGDSWSLDTAADANGALLSSEYVLVGNGVDIVLTGSVNDITAGDIDFYCQYIPLSSDGAVTAAA